MYSILHLYVRSFLCYPTRNGYMPMENRISVIIPVLNGARTLRDCVMSVFDQTLRPFEVIIVDNNSTDETPKICKELQSAYPELRYVFEAQRSRGAARNAGVRAARGSIIAMTDVDCVVPHDWLEKLTEPVRNGHETVTVGSQVDVIETYWSRNMQKMHDLLGRRMTQKDYVHYIDTKNFAIAASLMKTAFFDPSFKELEDEEFGLRLRPYAFFRFLPTVKVRHRHAQTFWQTARSAFRRSFWSMQLYHKFKNARDINRVLIVPEMTTKHFLRTLLYFDLPALKEQGISHLPFFLVYDCSWKLGRLIGYFAPQKEVMQLGKMQ